MQARGIVTDKHGSPVAGAIVAVVRSPVPCPDLGIVSGEDGTFTLPVHPGKYLIQAHTVYGERGSVLWSAQGDTPLTVQIGSLVESDDN